MVPKLSSVFHAPVNIQGRLWSDFSFDHNVACRTVTRQLPRYKQIYRSRYWVTPSQTNMFPRKRLYKNSEKRCFLCGTCPDVISGVEYLHSDPASRRRRQRGKSQIWDSKIWSRGQRASDHRRTALARASSIYKDRPVLLSERALHKNRTVIVND
jgi:hypothetical protein